MATYDLTKLGKNAKETARILRTLPSHAKNEALQAMADTLRNHEATILAANEKDVQNGKDNGLTNALIARLTLTAEKIEGMAQGIEKIIKLPDPLSQVADEWVNEDGLRITKRIIPLGVIGMIYESRPNVTSDASALCLKSGNAVILRGGSEAIHSNQAILNALQEGLAQTKVPKEAIQLIEDTSREVASEFMTMDDYLDCLIPRGGAGLIKAVSRQATVPVIETGVGNCHLYVHQAADLSKAHDIVMNAKLSYPSACNAVETLLVDQSVAKDLLPSLEKELLQEGVVIKAVGSAKEYLTQSQEGNEEDLHQEYLDLALAVKLVDGYDEAVDHIEHYSTGHSDGIVSQDYSVAQNFMNDINSATVYVNASTRFTDGEVFGFGGEIGISTQKLHARGPMGLEALTSYKYTVQGDGHTR
ncbi:glutamate-5-semialdehyde dehydrogenase [Dolosicoccus paucivorans]|uniref:glutamate-5-semialdehyde dehydrogenase n=1 Tax=Dolosicoccus paucivorans TaxID=84521 RepID=UPI00088A2F74|nr:glutamate-5-semialdehyde dehydrogenase [Dolosicoccus paucivorans]SDI60328.1 glutamate-5-semialdehyde dehydrogenase [Dolosicoccus paucivorans]